MHRNKIGFWPVFGIVTGSQIGSAIFTLPTFLAAYGIFGLIGSVVAGIGAIALAMVFALLCAKLPYTGGPHVYIRHAFGERVAFFGGWTYWLISWFSTTVVVITSIGYLEPCLLKLFQTNAYFNQAKLEVYLFLELLLLWLVGWINLKGVEFAGTIELFLTILKLLPLIILPMLALGYIDLGNLTVHPTLSQLSSFGLIGKAALLSMWGFIGLETGTVPAAAVINPKTTIPKATIVGTLSVALLYSLNLIAVMGTIQGDRLSRSSAPYVELAERIFGGNWYLIISVIAAIVCMGTLNAWILTSSQISLGLSKDGLMPKLFKKCNQDNVSIYGTLVSCLGMVPLLLLNFHNSLSEQINKILDISVVAFLFVYMMCILSLCKILYQEKNKHNYIHYLIALGALLFCAWVMYETSVTTLAAASLFVFSGIPLYLWKYYFTKNRQDF